MNLPGQDEGSQPLTERRISAAVALEGHEEIAEARDLARSFLADLQDVHGLTVSPGTVGAVQLVVSELVTNAQKYAPGPCLLTLELGEGAVEVTVWDSEPQLPLVQTTDPGRVGQHGLEIVTAVCRSLEMHREPVGKRIMAAVLLTEDAVGDMVGPQL